MARPFTSEDFGCLVKVTLVSWLGCLDYAKALELQMRICKSKSQVMKEDVLLLLEHPPTITLGRNGKWDNLLAPEELLKSMGIVCHEVDRGGDITFHGRGQLVGYPLLQLEKDERDVRRFMWNLEQSLIQVLTGYGIEGRRNEEYTGVWTHRGKIAALGVHISRWITRHGFALNVNTDLSFYDLIIPCGIRGKPVTSMCSHLGRLVDIRDLAERYSIECGAVFHRKMEWVSEHWLWELLTAYSEETETR
jgi:lipoate-protein ligase B